MNRVSNLKLICNCLRQAVDSVHTGIVTDNYSNTDCHGKHQENTMFEYRISTVFVWNENNSGR